WTGPDNFSSDLENPVILDPTAINMGQYVVVVTYVGGCTATSTTNVTITSLLAPDIDLSCATDICLGSSCVLSGTEYSPAPEFYNWEAIPSTGSGLPPDTENNQITITPTQAGTYIYNYSVELNGCESAQASQILIVHGAPDAVDDAFDITFETGQDIFVTDNDDYNVNIGINISVLEGGTAHGTLINNNNGTFTYTPDPGYIGLDQFTYQICYDCGPLLCENAVVTLSVNDDRECVFPTVITPNFDGFNDELFINCLEPIGSGLFPNNEIIIYNIWGDEVFTAAPYQNNWAGTYDGEDLPDGTYYVVFKLDDNSELIKQFITIFR
ncbi:MAG: gliding motility-associated-like protein, partial [Saprospiraceae bacterium]